MPTFIYRPANGEKLGMGLETRLVYSVVTARVSIEVLLL